MKKVIFVCLLTLSVCLSDTAVNTEKTPKPGNETAPALAGVVTPPAAPTAAPITPQAAPAKNETKPKEPEIPTQNTTIVTPAPESNASTNATTNNTADGKAEKPTTAPITAKPAEHNGTAPAAPTTEKVTTVKPTATTAQPHTLQARGFDGASFVGGIILTLGLLAIGFMGFKYYKAQTERNYHTL